MDSVYQYGPGGYGFQPHPQQQPQPHSQPQSQQQQGSTVSMCKEEEESLLLYSAPPFQMQSEQQFYPYSGEIGYNNVITLLDQSKFDYLMLKVLKLTFQASPSSAVVDYLRPTEQQMLAAMETSSLKQEVSIIV